MRRFFSIVIVLALGLASVGYGIAYFQERNLKTACDLLRQTDYPGLLESALRVTTWNLEKAPEFKNAFSDLNAGDAVAFHLNMPTVFRKLCARVLETLGSEKIKGGIKAYPLAVFQSLMERPKAASAPGASAPPEFAPEKRALIIEIARRFHRPVFITAEQVLVEQALAEASGQTVVPFDTAYESRLSSNRAAIEKYLGVRLANEPVERINEYVAALDHPAYKALDAVVLREFLALIAETKEPLVAKLKTR